MAGVIRTFLWVLMTQLVAQALSLNVTQCLQGTDKSFLHLNCTSNGSNSYILVNNVYLGVQLISSNCDVNAPYSACCSSTGCERTNNVIKSVIHQLCAGLTVCGLKEIVSEQQSFLDCNHTMYMSYASYMRVDYECVNYNPLLTTTVTTQAPSTTTPFSHNLTMGEQAAIICCIMLFIGLIGAAVVIYKRIKYGPPEDFRKLFSKPPPADGGENPIPWVPGEAQEQVYKTLAENEKKKKKKKLKFPKFKF